MNAKNVDVNTKEGYTIKEVESMLRKCRLIKIAGIPNDKRELGNLQDEIFKILDQNDTSNTVYLNGDIQSSKKRRSLGDIYRLLYQIDRNLRLEDLLIALGGLVKDNAIASYNCGVIEKRVFHFPNDKLLNNTNCRITADGERPDEFGWYWPAETQTYYIGGKRIEQMSLNKKNFD